MRIATILLFVVLTFTSCQRGPSDIKLPSLISNNMVLQQKTNARIWGTATPGHKISVFASWNVKAMSTAGKDGKWSVTLPAPEAGGPYSIAIAGRDTSINIENILSGEVWFCSGQSNMEMPLSGWPPRDTIMHSVETIAGAGIPQIRLFNVQKNISGVLIDDCKGNWEVSSPSSVKPFSATAYFFGRKLFNELNVPIGLIESAWGGTPAESWISSESLGNSGEFTTELAAIKDIAPSLEEYHSWLSGHKQVDLKPGGDDQWKDISFGDENIHSTGFDDSGWPEMTLPGKFENIIGEFDGAIWYRRKVDIPQKMTAKELVLSLGPIDDMDRAYFNGQLIGAGEISGLWQIDRNYNVPATLVKNGINTIAVRVLDNQGGGGIWGEPGKMKLSLLNNPSVSLSIEGNWKYQPVAELTGGRFYIFDFASNEFFSKTRPKTLGPYSPAVLYNAMVNPVIPYQIKGAIWYQGESNVGRDKQYSKIFPVMIQNWREAWGIKDFPFYFVQIAPYVYSNVDSTESAYLREAQEKALRLPNTGMAVTLDIATVMNIHPPLKKEVGERLALLALNNDYGMRNSCIGPLYKSMSVEGSTIKLQFENVGEGLVAKNGNLTEFEIAGKDGKYKKASAKIVNNEVLVSASSVSEPVAVRYCWRNGSEASLFNKSGLPAWQFRTKDGVLSQGTSEKIRLNQIGFYPDAPKIAVVADDIEGDFVVKSVVSEILIINLANY
jgi:sialate O-acetylesterase